MTKFVSIFGTFWPETRGDVWMWNKPGSLWWHVLNPRATRTTPSEINSFNSWCNRIASVPLSVEVIVLPRQSFGLACFCYSARILFLHTLQCSIIIMIMNMHSYPCVYVRDLLSSALSLSAPLDSLIKTYEINFRPQWIAMTSPTGNLCLYCRFWKRGRGCVSNEVSAWSLPLTLWQDRNWGTESEELQSHYNVGLEQWFHIPCCQKLGHHLSHSLLTTAKEKGQKQGWLLCNTISVFHTDV